MSRSPIVSNLSPVALVALVAVAFAAVAGLGWTLHARNADVDPAPDAQAAVSTAAQASGVDAATADRLAAQLTRIDSRLAALETRSSPAAASAPPATPEMPPAEADRRLDLLLPAGGIRTADLPRFYARLASLPPDDQFAIATALSRAINDRRIRVHP